MDDHQPGALRDVAREVRAEAEVDPAILAQYIGTLRARQSVLRGILGGVLAGAVAALAWGIFTAATNLLWGGLLRLLGPSLRLV